MRIHHIATGLASVASIAIGAIILLADGDSSAPLRPSTPTQSVPHPAPVQAPQTPTAPQAPKQ